MTKNMCLALARKWDSESDTEIVWAALHSQILLPEKVAHRACLSVNLNMYPNRQFLAHFVVHMPLCLQVLFRVAGLLHSNRGGGGAREASLGVCSLGGYCSAQAIAMQGGGEVILL